MSGKPTNTSRLEAELGRRGFPHMDPHANDEGRDHYYDLLMVGPYEGVSVHLDFEDRYSEKAVEMRGSIPLDKLETYCKALREHCKRKDAKVYTKIIVSVTCAAEVCEALRAR